MPVWFNHVFAAPPLPAVMKAVASLVARWQALPDEAVSEFERRETVESARSAIAGLLDAEPEEIVLTSGATEASNLALKGCARARPGGGRLLCSAVEHSSVLNPLRTLAREGFELVVLPVDRQGRVNPEDLERELVRGAVLVSIQHANHEVGTFQPLAELAALTRRFEVPLHVDALASAGLVPLDVRRLGIDLLSLSGARLGGLAGAGALWVRRGTRVLPQIEGGTQEGGWRGGAENLLGLAALGVAAREARGQEARRAARITELRDALEGGLGARVQGMTVLGAPPEERLPGHLPVSFLGAEGEALVLRLRQSGIEASTGSACSSEAGKPSHVLEAMGIAPEQSRCSVLFSLGLSSTREDVDQALDAVPRALASLREIGGSA